MVKEGGGAVIRRLTSAQYLSGMPTALSSPSLRCLISSNFLRLMNNKCDSLTRPDTLDYNSNTLSTCTHKFFTFSQTQNPGNYLSFASWSIFFPSSKKALLCMSFSASFSLTCFLTSSAWVWRLAASASCFFLSCSISSFCTLHTI